jgi:hypothetical protein
MIWLFSLQAELDLQVHRDQLDQLDLRVHKAIQDQLVLKVIQEYKEK